MRVDRTLDGRYAQGGIGGHRHHVRHGHAGGVDFDKRFFAGEAQHQQRFAVAQHVFEQARLVVHQLQGVLVLQQRADLVDARHQGGIVAQRQLRLKGVVQHHADHA